MGTNVTIRENLKNRENETIREKNRGTRRYNEL